MNTTKLSKTEADFITTQIGETGIKVLKAIASREQNIGVYGMTPWDAAMILNISAKEARIAMDNLQTIGLVYSIAGPNDLTWQYRITEKGIDLLADRYKGFMRREETEWY